MPSNFSEKQQEYLMQATHRWNFKTGATRSGKTFLDYSVVIPKRVIAANGEGRIVLIGNTNLTLNRNVIDPMREIWGKRLIGMPSSKNTVEIMGKTCDIIGADTKTAVKRLQGSGIQYCYGDEVATWNEEVFNMLKSRLDKPYSRFDGTCNPDRPTHYLKKFLDSDADIYQQSYTIYDNPFLYPEFVSNLEKEYRGTVYFDRFILGKWIAAEGIIYRLFADDPERFTIGGKGCSLASVPSAIMKIVIGVDFGGNGSGTAFTATAITPGFKHVVILATERHFGEIDPVKLNELFVAFARKVRTLYGRCDYTYCDSSETILIRGIKNAAAANGIPTSVRNAAKTEIVNRIRLVAALLSQGRFFITRDCASLRDAMRDALWNSKVVTHDERLDDGSTDIDSMDSMEYTIETDARALLAANMIKRG